jgi:hypothetical protein
MKKICVVGLLAGICGLANATQINAPSSLVGANVLDGNNAYEWGINLGSGAQVATAQIDFTGITLNVSGNSQGTGILYYDLLKSSHTGVATATDGDAPGDYWATVFSGANITSLGSQFFTKVGTTLTWSVILNASILNSYLTANNGVFNIGIDPDCHFTVGGLDFQYTTTTKHNSTPDVAMTAFLLGASLLGLEVFRRKHALAKAK